MTRDPGPAAGGAPTELTALEKYACAACGAQAEWTPSKQALVCPYCGTESPAELDVETGKLEELDLVRALRELPDASRGWNTATRTVRCRSCRAVTVFEPERVGQRCDFCGSPEIVDYEELKAPIRPAGLLPFRVEEPRIREGMRRWFKSKWLAPSRFKRAAMVDTVHGVYVPYWTFDAEVTCPWTADSGTYYYVTRRVRGADGKMTTRRERKVRWRPAAGRVDHVFDDEPIPGTRGVDLDLLRDVEPFPTLEAVPYDTAFLSGFAVEHYQVVLFDAAKSARSAMDGTLTRMCAAQVPGDTYRNLRISPEYRGQTFKLVLVPIWILSYDFGSKSFQVVANGYTGKVAGRYPKSWWKIAGLVGAALAVAGVLVLLLR